MKRFFVRSFFLVVIPLLGIGVAGYFYFTGGRYVVTENAYIKSRLFHISSDIDGRVVEVAVQNNQRLRQGDLAAAQQSYRQARRELTIFRSKQRRGTLDLGAPLRILGSVYAATLE